MTIWPTPQTIIVVAVAIAVVAVVTAGILTFPMAIELVRHGGAGLSDPAGRALMSLVPLKWFGQTALEDPASGIFRIWLDKEQVERLKAGKYFATIVRREGSCWIHGNLDKDPIFLLDSADPPADTPDAGSFYNQAPRMSAFEGDAYTCRPVK